MSRWSKKLAAFGVLLGTAGALSGGCASNESTLFIAGLVRAKAPDCVVGAAGSDDMLAGGTMDVAFTTGFWAWVKVGSQLAPRGDAKQLRTETMRIQLTGAEVTLTDSQGGVLSGPYSAPGVGFVNPGTPANPGYGTIGVQVIPPAEVGTGLAKSVGTTPGTGETIIVKLRVQGTTLGGQDITSGEFSFPLDLCYGCTVKFPLEAIDPTTHECTGDPGGTTEETCYAGQEQIDCRSCVASHPEVCLKPI